MSISKDSNVYQKLSDDTSNEGKTTQDWLSEESLILKQFDYIAECISSFLGNPGYPARRDL